LYYCNIRMVQFYEAFEKVLKKFAAFTNTHLQSERTLGACFCGGDGKNIVLHMPVLRVLEQELVGCLQQAVKFFLCHTIFGKPKVFDDRLFTSTKCSVLSSVQ
jgi:hypothetical protein